VIKFVGIQGDVCLLGSYYILPSWAYLLLCGDWSMENESSFSPEWLRPRFYSKYICTWHAW